MKKEVANIIRKLGGIPKYSGKDKTMYVHDGVANKHHEFFEMFTLHLANLDVRFKITYQIQ